MVMPVDIIQYSGHAGVPMPPATGGTWADVLALGNESGGNTPFISDGDGLHFGGDNSITVDNSLTFGVGIDLEVDAGNLIDITSVGDHFVTVGGLYSMFTTGDVEIFSDTGQVWLNANSQVLLEAPLVALVADTLEFDSTSGPIVRITQEDLASGAAALMRIEAQSSLGVTVGANGGDLNLWAGQGGVNATGGGIHMSPGGGNIPGSINITNAGGQTAIFIDGDNTPTGGQCIFITTAGLAFWDGTAAMKPTCTTELEAIEALGAMGLIDWAP